MTSPGAAVHSALDIAETSIIRVRTYRRCIARIELVRVFSVSQTLRYRSHLDSRHVSVLYRAAPLSMPCHMTPQKPKLHVVFDSNAIYTKTDGDEVVPAGIASLIKDPSHASLDVVWSVPDMVRLEREQHIRKNAQHVASLAEKLPNVFSGNWLLDRTQIDKEVERVVSKAFNELSISVLPCDYSLVAWASLVDAAGRRKPPFDPDLSKEKGFKDSIVAETLIQHWATLNTGHEALVLVSGDKILTEHVLRRTEGRNCRVVKDQDALRSELNFLASDIEESIAEKVKGAAEHFINGKSEFWKVAAEIALDESRASRSDEGLNTSNTRMTSYQTYTPVFLGKTLRRLKFSTQFVIHRVTDILLEHKRIQRQDLEESAREYLKAYLASRFPAPSEDRDTRRTWTEIVKDSLNNDRLSPDTSGRISDLLRNWMLTSSGAESSEPSATLFPQVASPIKAIVHWSVEFEMSDGKPDFLPETLRQDDLLLED
jgi:hypothetical protein